MKIDYKKLIVQSLYGLIEGSAKALEEALKDDFLLDYNLVPEKLIVNGTDEFIKNDEGEAIWIGTITVSAIIKGEEFTITRNWKEEYNIDITHPDYNTDINFYDSHKPQSSKKYREIMKKLEEAD